MQFRRSGCTVIECWPPVVNGSSIAALDLNIMNAFFLNFTRIVENNPRIYWSIIWGIAACLVLFIVEIVHVQNLLADLQTKDQNLMRAAIEPISSQYKWLRVVAIVTALLWSNFEYFKSKKKLGL